jgi:hypothetical protein
MGVEEAVQEAMGEKVEPTASMATTAKAQPEEAD